MRRLFQSLLLLIANATEKQLAKHVQYLKAENEILRARLPERIIVTPKERNRLLKFGRSLGSAINDLVTIVSPRTFLRWLQQEREAEGTASAGKPKTRNPGRPKTEQEVRDLVVRLARENEWGYTRILGELKKLGVRKICRSTVINILKENGLEPGPKRGEGTWDEFLTRHVQTLWACDFFSKKVWTLNGFAEMFVLFFIQIGTRKVHIAGITANPDTAWMKQAARNMAIVFAEEKVAPTYLIRDRDTKFAKAFDAILSDEGIETVVTSIRAPNMNAHAERFVQCVKSECLDHFLIFGEDHLRYLLKEFTAHFHDERPHQGIGNMPPCGPPPPPVSRVTTKDVVCETRLGGLLKHYRRAA